MKFLELVYPGIGFSVALMLFVLSLTQVDLYFRKGYRRSGYLAIFCFSSALFSLNVWCVYSRLLSAEFTHLYAAGMQFILPISFYFYLRSMSYFVIIPRWLKKLYFGGMALSIVIFLVTGFAHLFFSKYLLFDTSNLVTTGNFFVDSYTARIGQPTAPFRILVGLIGGLNMFATFVIMSRVARTSGDLFLIAGLVFSWLASFFEIFLLPFTLEYYVPVLFLSNIFEALRMCFLASMEALSLPSEKDSDDKDDEARQVSSLDEERLEKLTRRLEGLIDQQKIYLDSSLNLEVLARAMKIPSYQLSQVIRFGMKTNFSDLINLARIAQVQLRLRDPMWCDKTILDIAYSCGFNSKSTFNTAFKKQVGMTPSQYKKKG